MRRAGFAVALIAIACLYCVGLSRMGLVSKDEPRYADIGRAMAQTGDWITPRLSGDPWFEKPPLLYWMTALGFRAGLGEETAPRLPVALMSAAFFVFFWRKTRALFDERTASFATAMLATCGGWIAFSHVSVTDIPLAVTFCMAVLFALERRIVAAAAALGFAVMAKSLVPLVLFAPLLALDYLRWRDWLRPAPLFAFACITVPWHVLCFLRNGSQFPRTLFLEHQFGRFSSGALQHEQHWWFYIPVLLLLLFPWFPFFPFVFRAGGGENAKRIAITAIFGLVFFSLSVNKLPGYLLPLLPLLCILMARGASRGANLRIFAAATLLLLGLLPVVAAVLPGAIAGGLRNTAIHLEWHPLIACVAAATLSLFLLPARYTFAITAGAAAGALVWFQFAATPAIDAVASARPMWKRAHPSCLHAATERGLVYGLNYYAGRKLPTCDVDPLTKPVVR